MKISINDLARIYYGGGLAVGTKLYAEKDRKYTWVIYCGYSKVDWFRDFVTKCRAIGLKDDEKGIEIQRL